MSAETANSVTSFSLWIPLASAVVGGLVVAVFNHFFTKRRESDNEKRKVRVGYLLDAYRRLEAAANREISNDELKTAFESAVADIQLLGTKQQIETALGYIVDHADGNGAKINILLELLRDDLRQELGLRKSNLNIRIFRFTRHQTVYLGKPK